MEQVDAEAPRQGELLLNIRATIPATETIRSLHYEIHVINSDVQHIYYDHELYTIVLIVWSMHIKILEVFLYVNIIMISLDILTDWTNAHIITEFIQVHLWAMCNE